MKCHITSLTRAVDADGRCVFTLSGPTECNGWYRYQVAFNTISPTRAIAAMCCRRPNRSHAPEVFWQHSEILSIGGRLPTKGGLSRMTIANCRTYGLDGGGKIGIVSWQPVVKVARPTLAISGQALLCRDLPVFGCNTAASRRLDPGPTSRRGDTRDFNHGLPAEQRNGLETRFTVG
jgi:hypothetical protein